MIVKYLNKIDLNESSSIKTQVVYFTSSKTKSQTNTHECMYLVANNMKGRYRDKILITLELLNTLSGAKEYTGIGVGHFIQKNSMLCIKIK